MTLDRTVRVPDRFLLQIIDPDLGCSILEAMIPGKWHEEIRNLLGDAADEHWLEETWFLPPDIVARLSKIVGTQMPDGRCEALLKPMLRRQYQYIGSGHRTGQDFAHDGIELFLMMDGRKPFAGFVGRPGSAEFEELWKCIAALKEQGLVVSSCRAVSPKVAAGYDRGFWPFSPRTVGWRDDFGRDEEYVPPHNSRPAYKIVTDEPESGHHKPMLSVQMPRYLELDVARPDQEWRIQAYRQVFDEAGRDGWAPRLVRRAAWLLGYSEEEAEEQLRLERNRRRTTEEMDRESWRDFRRGLRGLARLYGPLAVLCLLFIAALFLTDQGRDLLVSSQVSFTGGIGLAIALSLVCVVACAAWASLPYIPGMTTWEIDKAPILFDRDQTGWWSRLKANAFAYRSFYWLFPSKDGFKYALVFSSIIAGVLLICHSALVALVTLLAGPVLIGGLLPRITKLLRTTQPRWGIGLALAAIVGVAAFPATVGIYLGSALAAAVLFALWISIIIFVTHWRGGKSLTMGAVLVIAGAVMVLKLLSAMLGADQRDYIRTVRGADVSGQWKSNSHGKLQSLAEMTQGAVSRQSGRPQIVLVAAAGGGVRAAYWTSFLLARATKPTGGMRDKLVMASGVSGGSLGLAVYRGLLQDSPPDCGVSAHETPLVNCVQNFFRNDFLAPPLAATLSGRLFNMILPLSPFPRQNESLERGWEAAWRRLLPTGSNAADAFAKPFLDLWGPNGWGRPALVLNATALSSGDRAISSGVSIEDGWFRPHDCRVNLAEQIPLPLSAAAGASARFPFLSELGWLKPSTQTGCKELEGVGDGGYFDNFGAATVIDALHHLNTIWANKSKTERPYVIVIQITSDPDCSIRRLDPEGLPEPESCGKESITFPDGRFWRWQTWKDGFNFMKASFKNFPEPVNVKTKPADAGPLDLLLQARFGYGMGRAQQLRRQVLCEFQGSYYHFSLAGTAKVPLGWTLSQRSRTEIENLLTKGANGIELERLIRQLEIGSTEPMRDKACLS